MEQKGLGVCVFRAEQLWGADDEALIDSLLALEWQRGIPASFCPSSLSPCNNLRSGILPAFLYGLVCLSLSSPFTACNIHAELISSRHRPPDPISSLQVIALVHPAFSFQSGRVLPPHWLRRRPDVTACKRSDSSSAAAAVVGPLPRNQSNTYFSLFSSARSCCYANLDPARDKCSVIGAKRQHCRNYCWILKGQRLFSQLVCLLFNDTF